MFVCRAGSCSDSAEVPEGTRPRLGSGEQQMLRLLAAVQGTCCPSLAPATPPSVWLDGNTAVHHNPPSVASSPVADNLAVVHACALSWCLRPGWRGGSISTARTSEPHGNAAGSWLSPSKAPRQVPAPWAMLVRCTRWRAWRHRSRISD